MFDKTNYCTYLYCYKKGIFIDFCRVPSNTLTELNLKFKQNKTIYMLLIFLVDYPVPHINVLSTLVHT